MLSYAGMQAILLCGGKGERLRPLTDTLPKPLVPICGKPIVEYIVRHLENYGISDIIVAAGHQAHKLEDYFSNRPHIQVIDSGDVDIIERIRSARSLIKGDFLVLYGDTLSDVNIDELISFHKAGAHKVTITGWPFKSQFGLMELGALGEVLSFKEKPVLDKWINIGHFCFSHEALSWFDDFDYFENFLMHLVDKGLMQAYRHRGVHITVNTQKELEEAENSLGQIWGSGPWQSQKTIGRTKEFSSPESTALLGETSPKRS